MIVILNELICFIGRVTFGKLFSVNKAHSTLKNWSQK